ncbi:MAG TPA: double-strand break repair helicase AddA [Rhizomicrobium sp.]
MSNAALDPARSVWVSANAGSGKTYTLANRVARLLLEDVKPERILCLTYTKAAAAEMQGRLFDQLGQWAMAPSASLAANIDKIGGATSDLPKARRLFADALETPGGLKINTIHSFCQNLLARFPLEAGVAPGFRVLDDQTTRDLMADARARVLERAGNGEAVLAQAVTYLVTHTSENRLNLVLDAALGGDRRKLERFLDTTKDPQAAIYALHGATVGEHYEELAQSFCDEMRDEEAKLRDVAAWLQQGGANDGRASGRLLTALKSGAYDDLRAFFLTSEGKPRVNIATARLIAADPALNTYVETIAARFHAAEARCRAAHAAALAQAAVTLAAAGLAEYARAKQARASLDYDDLIARTLHLLRDRATSAWVLCKLDGGIDHVLIDEAQDTSPEQWQIVRALTAEFFAGEGRPLRGPRTVFAVGDEKQSIFSFQGADPRQFEGNRDYFAKQATEGALAFTDVTLDTSRRSAPEILKFVDHVFAGDAGAALTFEGAPVAHTAHRKADKGQIEFWPVIHPDKTPDLEPWRPVDAIAENSPVARLADQIATQIKRWTDGKTSLPGHNAPIREGDIMILMPRREPFAGEMIRRLKERGVKVAGADRIRLNEQIAVMDLAALGRFVLLPEDDLNLAALLRSPLIDIGEDDLLDLANPRAGTLWAALDARREETKLVRAHAYLSECRARADFAPPYEFYARALSADGVRKRLLARLGPEANDAIDEFLSLTLSYEAANPPSLEGFLHWLARGDAEIKRDMERGRDEVRVMTVHGAKGLEADIIILPDTTTVPEGTGQHGNLLWTQNGPLFPVANDIAPSAVVMAKQDSKAAMLREHRRLFYVALTRARDRLCICGFANKHGVKQESWYALAEKAAKALGAEIEKDGKKIYAFGDAEMQSIAPAGAEPAKFLAPAWATARPAVERARPRLIRPSDAAGLDEPPVFSPANAARFQRGLLIHDLLARLPDVEAPRRREIALSFLAARGVDAAQAAKLADETLAVLDNPQFAPAFAPGSRAEIAIVADLPQIGDGARISGRIDRLAVTDREILAVDFKTNRPPPTRVENVSGVYMAQMALYRAALAKIFPGRRIACALVWTEGPSLMPLPDAKLDAEIRAIRARLDSEATRS